MSETAVPMPMSALGASGPLVSRLGLGTMTFGVETDQTDAFAQLDAFVDRGGTLIDTADVYGGGESEAIVGRWLADRRPTDCIVALNGVDLNDFQNWAIRGLNVTGLSLTNSHIYHSTGKNGDIAGSNEGSVYFGDVAPNETHGLGGAVTISSTTIEDGFEDNLWIPALSGTLNLTMTNNIIKETSSGPPGNNGFYLEAGGSGTVNAVITNSTFTANRANGIRAATSGSGNMNIRIGSNGVDGSGGTFSNSNTAINLNHGGSGTYTFNVLEANLSNAAGQAAPLNINMLSGASSCCTASSAAFRGNVIGNTITNHASGVGPALRVVANSWIGATMTINVAGIRSPQRAEHRLPDARVRR